MKTIRIACDVKDYLPLEQLEPLQGKLKELALEDRAALRKEILETGFAFPFYIWRPTSKKTKQTRHLIIGGHQRLKVLLELKAEGYSIDLVPVVYILAATLKEALRRVLQDVGQYGRVTKEGLIDFMVDAEITIEDLSASFRIPDLEVGDLVDKDAGSSGAEDDIPAIPVKAKSKIGEIYQLGAHRVMCGDATDAAVVAQLMAEERADMVWTDPPYNVAYEGKTKDALTILNDKMDDSSFFEFLLRSFKSMLASAKPGAPIYIAHADLEGMNFRKAMKEAGWLLKQCLIWKKNSMVMGRQDYHWQHEPILYGWAPGAAHKWYSDRNQVTVLEFDRPTRNGEHPTMKPVALIEYMLGNSSKAGDLVLDLFGGSGSTLIACENTGRACRTMELDPVYVDVIVERWEKFTGRQSKILNGKPAKRKKKAPEAEASEA
jgi:DNA modification methylase